MNEKIKELAQQAGLIAKQHDDLDFKKKLTANEQKFAELIVKECIGNMQNGEGDMDFVIWKTKKDFGVEE